MIVDISTHDGCPAVVLADGQIILFQMTPRPLFVYSWLSQGTRYYQFLFLRLRGGSQQRQLLPFVAALYRHVRQTSSLRLRFAHVI